MHLHKGQMDNNNNFLIRFCYTMVLLMTTGQSMVHYQTNFIIHLIFVPPGVFSWSNKKIITTIQDIYIYSTIIMRKFTRVL